MLPEKGLPAERIRAMLRESAGAENAVWKAGKCSGSVYHGGAEHQALLNEAFSLYSLANPLHADVFPSLVKFEAEIVSMTAALVGGGEGGRDVRGGTTSGGTESIILAMKAHRDYYRSEHGITDPDMVCCVTAHAAVDKGCEMLGIRLKKVPADPCTHMMDVSALQAAIGPNTILLYASAPNFPQGTVDDIPAMAALAKRYGTGTSVPAFSDYPTAFLDPSSHLHSTPRPQPHSSPLLAWNSCHDHGHGRVQVCTWTAA